MSFSSELKEELSRQTGGARHCQIAELTALFLFQGNLTDPEKGTEPPGRKEKTSPAETASILLETENYYLADKARKLLRRCIREPFQVREKTSGKTVRYQILADRRVSDQLLQMLHLQHFQEGTWIHQISLQRNCCRRAFLRGAFLASGAVTNPDRSYQFEILCDSAYQAEQIAVLMGVFHIQPGISHRRKYYVVYVKEGEEIGKLLGLMDARVTLLNYENIRVVREVRGNVNRRVNCETANIRKTAGAAAKQMEDIRYIDNTIGLHKLPNGLDEIAEVRLQYPTATLQELGEYLNPPVGKSGVNHRLRKLSAIAERLRRTNEEET